MIEGVVWVHGNESALGLGDDLLGDDDHVTVEEALGLGGGGPGDDAGEVVSGVDLGDCGHRPDGQRRPGHDSTARARDTATPGSLMMVRVTNGSIPSSATASARSASASSMTKVRASGA